MHLTIIGNPIPKKNSQQIFYNGRHPFISQSNRYKEYEKQSLIQIPKINPINKSVNVCCVFYRDSKRRVDLVNLQESILDILVKGGVLEDDNFNIVSSMDGSRVEIDKENPRVEIEIEGI